MTLPEFKAWFEGFTEDLAGPPNKKQWTRIQERVNEITGQAVSYPVYIDRYVAPLRPYWTHPVYGYNALSAAGTAQGINGNASAMQLAGQIGSQAAFNSCTAMAEVGRVDARALAA